MWICINVYRCMYLCTHICRWVLEMFGDGRDGKQREYAFAWSALSCQGAPKNMRKRRHYQADVFPALRKFAKSRDIHPESRKKFMHIPMVVDNCPQTIIDSGR